VMSQDKLNDLAESAKLAINSAKSAELYPVSAGVAHAKLREVSLKEVWVLVESPSSGSGVGDKSFAYVVFDSNNMHQAKEKILVTLREMALQTQRYDFRYSHGEWYSFG